MLYLVPTPIGNLDDITLRAVKVLQTVDLVACEDTRVCGKLLAHLEINVRKISYHDHNERSQAEKIIAHLKDGASVALVSDAGSPGISDPGFYLVRRCIEEQIPVTALPGASALIPALTASGLPSDKFAFEGFLPAKKGRKSRLEALSEEPRTVVLYESPHRLVKTLNQLAETFGADRPCAVAREISKMHEEFARGTLSSVAEMFSERPSVKGECVIVVGPPAKNRQS